MEEALETQALLAAITGTDPLVYIIGVVGILVGVLALFVAYSHKQESSTDKKIAQAVEQTVYREAQNERWQDHKVSHAHGSGAGVGRG